MKKIISYSLYGTDEKYTIGLKRNIDLLDDVFPGWIIRVYYDDSISEEVLDRSNPSVEYIKIKNDNNYMFWRFYAWDDPDVDIFISRDVDDRLNRHDFSMISEWEKSSYGFTVARSPFAGGAHNIPMLGGMWGGKPKCYNIKMRDLIEKFKTHHTTTQRGDDQFFLITYIWPLVASSTQSYGSKFNYECADHKDLPIESRIGGAYDAHIKTSEEYWNA